MNTENLNPNTLKNNICENAPVGFILVDKSNNVLYANSQSKKLLKLKEIGANISDLPQYLEPFKKKVIETKKSRAKYDIFFNLSSQLKYFEVYINPLKEEDNTLKILTFLDKTDDLKKLDLIKSIHDDLHQFKSLAAMGTMISGVAHELNNPISGISMSSQLAENALKTLTLSLSKYEKLPDVAFHEILEAISFALSELEHVKLNTTRSAKIVGSLLNYSKKEKLELENCSLNNLIEETLKVTKYQQIFYKTNITIECPEDIHFNCDKSKIQQVLYNILKNAAESITENGEIIIKSYLLNDLVHISISDNGTGIPKSSVTQLFTPFYTTKEQKGGTGLGLSISHRIVERHGGKIIVNSKVGLGTEFIVILPLNVA